MMVLTAIANHGSGNRQYLDRLLAAYQEMPFKAHPVILSNIPKDLGSEVEVCVGVPSENPWSLPFAHRPLFRERIEEYDFFIYSEDDTLLEWPVLDRFIRSVNELEPDEIAGFMRTETGPDGQVYYSTSHSFFRWLPDTVRERGGKLWAQYSNEHAALFIASRDQLKRAIDSGGFGDEPHEGRHDMLCSAATDIYTRCGFERLVCIDDLDGFVLPHLPNKYIGKMGLPKNEMEWQLEALHRVHAGELSDASLVDPETKLPGGFGSKFCREAVDEVIRECLGDSGLRVLSWCSGDGVAEADLASRGHSVTVQPLDAVLGCCCERRGLGVIEPRLEALGDLKEEFDVVIVRDVLHLLQQPEGVLDALGHALRAGGRLILRVPNLNSVSLIKKRRGDPRYKLDWNYDSIGAEPYTPGSLRSVLRAAGFADVQIRGHVPEHRRKWLAASLGTMRFRLSPFLYAVAQKM